jgi:hypothetical protein
MVEANAGTAPKSFISKPWDEESHKRLMKGFAAREIKAPKAKLAIQWWDDETLRTWNSGCLYSNRNQYGFFVKPREIFGFYLTTPTIIILTKNTRWWFTPLVLLHEVIHYLIWLTWGYSFWFVCRRRTNELETENCFEQAMQFFHELIWKGPDLAWQCERQKHLRTTKARKMREAAEIAFFSSLSSESELSEKSTCRGGPN